MRRSILTIVSVLVSMILLSCSNAPVDYNADNPGPILHYISTDTAEIFHNRVEHEAALEARGVEPPVGNASWREFWKKMIAYWSGEGAVGTHRDVAGYIIEQRSARGLAPL
jgi:hypothetical protein